MADSLTKIQALARALYTKNGFVVLDDVLAGLDYTTEGAVFSRVLGLDGLLRRNNTTTVFATHAGKSLFLARRKENC